MQFTISASPFLFLVCTSALPHAFVHENSTEHVEGESLVAPISYVGIVTNGSEHHQLNGTVEVKCRFSLSPGIFRLTMWAETAAQRHSER